MRGLRWSEEFYARAYQRDTAEWLDLSWRAQGLYLMLRRKADRAGLIQLGRTGRRGVAAVLGARESWAEIEPVLQELLDIEYVELGVGSDGAEVLVIPEYIESEEAQASVAQRKRAERLRAHDKARSSVLRSTPGVSVTLEVTPGVTPESHRASRQTVTLEVTPGVTPGVTPESHARGHSPLTSLTTQIPQTPAGPPAKPEASEPPPTKPGAGGGDLSDPVQSTLEHLRRMPPPICWLEDSRAEERLASGCLGGQARLADVIQAITNASTKLGAELAQVAREDERGMQKLERFVAGFVTAEPRRRRELEASKIQIIPADARAALDLFASIYEAGAWGAGPYCRAGDDEENASKLVFYARSKLGEHPTLRGPREDDERVETRIIKHVCRAFIDDPFFKARGHSLAALVRALEKEPARFGLPAAGRDARAMPTQDPDDDPFGEPIAHTPAAASSARRATHLVSGLGEPAATDVARRRPGGGRRAES